MSWRAAFWLVLVAGAALRIVGLGSQSLWWDEAWQHYVVTGEGFSGFWGRLMNPRITLNPPLYHLVSYLSVRALSPVTGGVTDATLRLPSAILGILGLPSVFALVRCLFPGDRALATLAMALVAFAPFHVHYSQEARMYTLVMLLAALSTLALVRAVRAARPSAWALYTLSAASAVYTHVHTLFGLLGHAIWVLITHRRRFKAFVLSGLATALLFLPMVGFFVERVGNLKSPYGGAGASLFSVPYSLFVYSVGLSMGPSVAELKANRTLAALTPDWPVVATVALVFGALIIAGILDAGRRDPRTRALLLSGWLAPILGVSAAALLPDMTFNVRYTAWGFPFFIVILALGLSAAWRVARPLGVAAALAVAALFVVSDVSRLASPRYGKEDVRGAVAAWRSSGERKILFSYNGSPTVERYLAPGEIAWHVPIYRRSATRQRMTSVLEEVAVPPPPGAVGAARDTVYVLLARDVGRIVETEVRGRFPVPDSLDLAGGVTLLRVEVPARISGPPEVTPFGAPRGEE